MPDDIYLEWMAYHRHVPTEAEYLASKLIAAMANIWGDSRRDKVYREDEFLPPSKRLKPEAKPKTADDMKAVMFQLARVGRFNG